MDVRHKLGRAGEDLAARLYRSQGFHVVERNFRCPEGEIDLILQKGRLLVFCEVKTRRSDRFGEPSEAVTSLKQQRLRRLAARWLRLRTPGTVDVRFDVVSIVVDAGRARVEHVPDAF